MIPHRKLRNQFVSPAPEQSRHDMVRQAKTGTPWKLQSVAVIIMSPDGTQVALCLPKKVRDRGEPDNLRVPLQGRFQYHNADVLRVASSLLFHKLDIKVPTDEVTYIGYGLGNRYVRRGSGVTLHRWNKVIHWCAVLLPFAHVPAGSDYAHTIDWFHLKSVVGVSTYTMEPQKRQLFMQALRQLITLPGYAELRSGRLLEAA